MEELADVIFQRIENRFAFDCRLFDLEGAAHYLGMTPKALRHKSEAGKIPKVLMDGKLRFDRRDLDRLIDTAQRNAV